MPDSATPGDRIRERQDALSVSNRQLAVAAGVSESTVSQWRRGRQQPKDRHLRAVAPVLRTSAQWLRYGGPEAASPPSVSEASEPYRAPVGLPQQARVWMHTFLLELATGGATEEEIDAARRLLTSEEAYAMYAGGVSREMSADDVLTEMQGVAEGIRILLRRRGRKV